MKSKWNGTIRKIAILLIIFSAGLSFAEDKVSKEDSYNNKWEISDKFKHVPYTKEEIEFATATTEDEDEPVVSCGEYPEYCSDEGDSGVEKKN